MYGFGYGYGHGFHGGCMIITAIIIIALIAFAIYLLMKNRSLKNNVFGNNNIKNNIDANSNGKEKAMEILNEKLALGEITEEEYTRRKELINS